MGTFLFFNYNSKTHFAVMVKDEKTARHWAYQNMTSELHFFTREITGIEHNYKTFRI